MMDEHTPGLKRRYTDAELRTHTTTELYDLAGECEVEPADPTICDACAAYLIAQEKDDGHARLAHEFVLGATDADALHPPHQVRDGLLAYQVAANRDEWMARAMVAEAALAELRVSPVVTRHDDGTITMEWPEGQLSTLVSREVLEGMLDEHNGLVEALRNVRALHAAAVTEAAGINKPFCLFQPGDRVIVLMGSMLEPATVQQIRIPGPINADQTVQVILDEPQPGQMTAMWWFDPDQVERLGA
jgi:hypothetical protein